MEHHRYIPIGHRTRPLLAQAKVTDEYLDGIEVGLYTWTCAETVGSPATWSSRALTEAARAAARNDLAYTLTIYPTPANEELFEEFGDDGVYVGGVSRWLGQQLVWSRDLEARGE